MPVVVPALTSSIVSIGASLGIVGTGFPLLANAVSLSCAKVFSLPGTVSVAAAGAAGTGSIVPGPVIVGVVPSVMASLIQANMAASGMSGAMSYNQALAISTGITTTALPSLILIGVSLGVGSGVGTGKVVSFNNVLFGNDLYMNMASQGFVGTQAYTLARAIADGVCLAINSAGTIPVVTIAGPAGPAPGATIVAAQFI